MIFLNNILNVGRKEFKDGILLSGELDSEATMLLRDIVVDSAYKTGDEFFKSAVKELGESTGADFTFIGKLSGESQDEIETLAIYSHGQYMKNFTYSLKDTPCANVIGKEICIYKDRITELFPKDLLLIEMGVAGYIGVPLFDSEGRSLGILVELFKDAVTNTTRAEAFLQLMANRIAGELERWQLELKLRKSESKFRQYVEVSPVGIFLFNRSGRFLFFNRAAINITGYSKDEALKLSLKDLTFSDKRQRFTRKLNELFQKGQLKTEITLKQKSGEGLKAVVEIIQVEDDIYLGYCTDISELNRMELKLRQSEKMRAIGQLAGGIAHDFNNQLSGIVGYADLLKRKVGGDPLMGSKVNGILTAARRATDLTTNLLTFAREDRYISEVMDVNEVIIEVVELLKRSIDRRINIATEFPEESPFVNGDPTQIQNLLLNLGINARDAMPDGGDLKFSSRFIELDHDYCSFSEFSLIPGMYVVISVSDNGIGMDEETLKRIFEPFFTTKKPGFGTGMGLAAVYGTVKAHKGEVVVESNPGYGTTFEIMLPLETEVAGVDKEDGSDIEPFTDFDKLALLVDDDDNLRNATELVLMELGIHSVSFENGQDALNYFKHSFKDIGVIIIDTVLPDMSGIDLYRSFMKLDGNVNVLITTGHNIEDIARETEAEGVAAVLQKPFYLADIYSVLSELFK